MAGTRVCLYFSRSYISPDAGGFPDLLRVCVGPHFLLLFPPPLFVSKLWLCFILCLAGYTCGVTGLDFRRSHRHGLLFYHTDHQRVFARGLLGQTVWVFTSGLFFFLAIFWVCIWFDSPPLPFMDTPHICHHQIFLCELLISWYILQRTITLVSRPPFVWSFYFVFIIGYQGASIGSRSRTWSGWVKDYMFLSFLSSVMYLLWLEGFLMKQWEVGEVETRGGCLDRQTSILYGGWGRDGYWVRGIGCAVHDFGWGS